MTESASAATANLDWVIDADTHVTEPPDLFTTRLEKKWLDVAPRVVVHPEAGYEVWAMGKDGLGTMPIGHTAVAGWPEPFPAAPMGFSEVPKAAYDAHARLAYMDSLRIWAAAVYPNVGGFGSQAFLTLGDPELMIACVRAYNDFLTDWCATAPARLIPITAVPLWDVEAAVAEVERCAKAGHKGILFSGAPQDHGFPLLADPHWNPLWECAQALDLPVSFHLGSGEFTSAAWTPERVQHYGVGSVNAQVTIGLFLENGRQIVDLLFSGILARYPTLKFISVESGIGFVPFLLEAADYTFDYGHVGKQRPEFKMKPSEYFARQVYGCYWFEELPPRAMREQIPADNILFETDYPHPVCLYGNVREKIEAGLSDAPHDYRRKLLFGNAARLYGVDAPPA